MESPNKKHRILIADDSEMNRAILEAILGERFDIVGVENGRQAVAELQAHSIEYSLVLLDIVMPEMDGFEVLSYMNSYRWIDDVPVIMISSENSPDFIERAYDLGASDYIQRPFDAAVVLKRVQNTITLYAKQRKLMGIVADQVYKREKSSAMMVAILSHIVEFRNGESGLHTLHINKLTELLLSRLSAKGGRYYMSKDDITIVSLASSLHDIGKISVPDGILNKPGKLTDEEYAIMKGHSMAGAEMLGNLPLWENEPLVKAAYEIARWHHERYDGRGYPDGLKGDDIPITAQVVSIADVYDALTSQRCYKAAFSHEKAMEMILGGECGAFNPTLLECLSEAGEDIKAALADTSQSGYDDRELSRITDELLRKNEVSVTGRAEKLLEFEQAKTAFTGQYTDELLFSYSDDPACLRLSHRLAEVLGVPPFTVDPKKKETLFLSAGDSGKALIKKLADSTDGETTDFETDIDMTLNGSARPVHAICRSVWSDELDAKRLGIVGKLIPLKGESSK